MKKGLISLALKMHGATKEAVKYLKGFGVDVNISVLRNRLNKKTK